MKNIILVIGLLCFAFLSLAVHAQKTRIGCMNSDSLMRLIPGYIAAYDTMEANAARYHLYQVTIDADIVKKKHEYDSLENRSSAIINELHRRQIEQMDENREAFLEYVKMYKGLDSLRIVPFREELYAASQLAMKKNKCTAVCDQNDFDAKWDKDSFKRIDINRDVAASLKASPTAMKSPKRIGFANRDSLLNLIPGYKTNADKKERELYDLNDSMITLTMEHQRKMEELDSARTTATSAQIKQLESGLDSFNVRAVKYYLSESDSIVYRDSIRNSASRKRLDDAMITVRKKTSCFYVYDVAIAHEIWAEKEAEFVNVNAEVTRELGL